MCPCDSGHRFQSMLHEIRPTRWCYACRLL
ncbi:hypothetical protein [Aliikangiella sp. IMCC44359]